MAYDEFFFLYFSFEMISFRLDLVAANDDQWCLCAKPTIIFHIYIRPVCVPNRKRQNSPFFFFCFWLIRLCMWISADKFNTIGRLASFQRWLNVNFALWLLNLYDNFPLHFTRRCAINGAQIYVTIHFEQKRKHAIH